ncbi:MAG: hypothetical protein LBJ63_11240 [Prevotellaceae bacterium]|jgi:hypothetical protein|nr:hypothetical protein [Prevotellaceae bacterium]
MRQMLRAHRAEAACASDKTSVRMEILPRAHGNAAVSARVAFSIFLGQARLKDSHKIAKKLLAAGIGYEYMH